MIGEDTAVSESAEHKHDLKKHAHRVCGMITGSVSESLLVELDELKGDKMTETTGTGEDQVTTTYFAEPTAEQLWNYLKGRFQKKDGTSAILDFQQMVSTRFHGDNTLENQLSAIQVLRSRCALNDFDLTNWQYATILLLTLPSTVRATLPLTLLVS